MPSRRLLQRRPREPRPVTGAAGVTLHLVYLEQRLLLRRDAGETWRDLQAHYADYRSSLGPWPADQACAFLAAEYPELEPAAAVQVEGFLASGEPEAALLFAPAPGAAA